MFHQWQTYRTLGTLRDSVTEDTNDLLWWRLHKPMFPDLYRLARVFLAIPLSSTTIERLWSKLKRVLTKARGNLDVDLGGKQVWCHESRLCTDRLREAFEADMIPAMGRRETGVEFSMESFLKAYEVKNK